MLADRDNLQSLVDILKGYTYDEKQEAQAKKDAARGPEGKCNEKHHDGRLLWLFKNAAWRISYEDDLGAAHTTMKGLDVAREDIMGKPLSAAVFGTAKAVKENKAKILWTELDQSGAERFVIVPAH